MRARWRSGVVAIVLAITLTSGCKAAPSTATASAAPSAAATPPAPTQATPARPEPATYPNPSPADACPDRVDVAMACFDLGVGAAADCGQVIAARTAVLKDRDAACRTSLLETCTLGCSLGHEGKESRDHFLMLMTSPPP